MLAVDLDHVWHWRPSPQRPVHRKGEPCRVLVRGRMNSVLVEFADGHRVVTSRHAVRRVAGPPPQPRLFP